MADGSPLETLRRLRVGSVCHPVSTDALDKPSNRGQPLQDFCPLVESLEWKCGQQYWNRRGVQAFVAGDVPYIVNNDGYLSLRAAKLLFASLARADQESQRELPIQVLEIGAGSGLFARLFLLAFRELCDAHKRDYWSRLRYVVADRSEQMLADICDLRLLADFPAQHTLSVIDALDPSAGLNSSAQAYPTDQGPFHAIFLNYVLDQLPACVFELREHEVRQLHVRTYLVDETGPRGQAAAAHDQLLQAARAQSPDDIALLADYFDRFVVDYAYLPVDPHQLPYGPFACEYARQRGESYLLVNYGAIQCLERVSLLLRAGGFALIHDYPHKAPGADPETYQHQRFGGSTQIGVNFALLDAFFDHTHPRSLIAPTEDNDHITARLLGGETPPETFAATLEAFQDLFCKSTFVRDHEHLIKARCLTKEGCIAWGLSQYEKALKHQPNNWMLLGEIAGFLTDLIGDPAAGLTMAQQALELNPISDDLWNALGDSLVQLGRTDDAHTAYLQAIRLSPSNPRGYYNLSDVLVRLRDDQAALRAIADGLHQDVAGTFRERLMARQQEILQSRLARHHDHLRRDANRLNWVS